MARDGAPGEPGGDAFDDVVLDEAFLRGGPVERSADERLEQLKRIAREHEQAAGWRQGPAAPVRASAVRPRRRRRGRVLLTLVLTAGVLAGVAWWQGAHVVPLALEPAGRDAVVLAGPDEPAAVEGELAPPVVEPVRLAPLPVDPGGEGGYRFQEEQDEPAGTAVAYDPCRPITWVVRRQGEPPGGDALLTEAFAELSAATGLVFQRGPDTDEPLDDRRDLVQPERYGAGPAPVLVGWSDERESPDLAGYIAGFAGSSWHGFDEPGSLRYVTGLVVLDTEQEGRPLGPADAASLRSTVLHELGHLVGLAHVADPEQLMYSEGGDNRLDLGPGDRRGLRLLGAGRCFTDWDALLAG